MTAANTRDERRWVRRTRRVLQILSTGGMVWITETAKPRERR